jgi:ABC-type phosphate transport system substrate-binding protein
MTKTLSILTAALLALSPVAAWTTPFEPEAESVLVPPERSNDSSPGAYLVVSHAALDGLAIPRDVLASVFLLHKTRWQNGEEIHVVDQSMSSPVRARFSRDVLERSPRELLAHWRDVIRSGRRPPRVKSTDEEVLAYVASTPGAIGYVTVSAPVRDVPVKILAIQPDS